MSSQTPKMVQVKILDKALSRYYVEGITTLPADQAADEVALGRVAYVEDVPVKSRGGQEPPRQTPRATASGSYLSRHGFARGFTKVAWVQDNSKRGGAELSNEVVVAAGESCGFSVVGVTPQNFREEILHDADLIVVNNFFEFSHEQALAVQAQLYEWRIPFVKYEHDLRELRRENTARALFGGSILNVFLSPAHMQAHAHLTRGKNVALPLAVKPERYPETEMTDTRRKAVLIPTARKAGKATYEWAQAHPELHYYVLGALERPLPVERKEGVPPCTAEKMHEWYARVGTVLHLPDELWAGERVALEAKLCGCEVVVNSNVGHASWEWFGTDTREQLEARLSAAPYQFWRAVEEALCRARAR